MCVYVHERVYVHARENVHAREKAYVHVYVHVYMYENVFVLETATRSKKHETIVEGHKHVYSAAQDSTAVSDGTGEAHENTHFAITEKILIISAPQSCM